LEVYCLCCGATRNTYARIRLTLHCVAHTLRLAVLSLERSCRGGSWSRNAHQADQLLHTASIVARRACVSAYNTCAASACRMSHVACCMCMSICALPHIHHRYPILLLHACSAQVRHNSKAVTSLRRFLRLARRLALVSRTAQLAAPPSSSPFATSIPPSHHRQLHPTHRPLRPTRLS